MRNAFAAELFECAQQDEHIVVVAADISPAGRMAEFAAQHPDRFINVGVAEQAMVGIAAGLALKGMRPFCYTIAPFSLYRPFEFVRNDLCYQNLPVTIVGMGAGLSYPQLGTTHQSIEDIAVASAIPNMQVIVPCDLIETRAATRWCALESKGPSYLRLGKSGEPDITSEIQSAWWFNAWRLLRRGKLERIGVLSYGPIAGLALQVAHALDADCAVVSTIKPLPDSTHDLVRLYERIIVVEEHVYQGGLGQRLRAIAQEEGVSNPIDVHCIKDKFLHYYGTREQLLAQHGLSFEQIVGK